jgi:tRNA G18 (ribose-2'-O)-methylase SpoU
MKASTSFANRIPNPRTGHRVVLKDLVQLASDTEVRRDSKRCILSGHKIVTEYLQTGKPIHQLFATKRYRERHGAPAIINGDSQGSDIIALREGMIEKVTREARSEGIIAIVPFCPTDLLKKQQSSRILHPIGVRDPRNLGALIRSAHALGYRIYPKDCCCPFSIEAIRAARGVHLIHDDVFINTDIDKYQLIAAELPSKIPKDAKWRTNSMPSKGASLLLTGKVRSPFAVVVGNESHGLPNEVSAHVYAGVETVKGSSLNVSMAASIIMFALSTGAGDAAIE